MVYGSECYCKIKCKKIERPFRGALFMGEEKPDEELMGNVSLLRGCLRHLATPIILFCPFCGHLYLHDKKKMERQPKSFGHPV